MLCNATEVDFNSSDNDGRSLLLSAAERGYKSAVKLLLKTGKVNVDLNDTETGRTPLSYAAEEGWEAIVTHLLAAKRRVKR